MLAGAGDLFEIESSKLLLSHAKAGSVQLSPLSVAYAEQMIRDHSRLTAKMQMALMRLAGPQSPLLQPQLTGTPFEGMMARLSATPVERLERVYLLQQLKAHRLALGLHSRFAVEGDNRVLRQLAMGATPVVQQHLNEVEQLLGLESPNNAGLGVLMRLAQM